MAQQAAIAIDEADLVLFVVDGARRPDADRPRHRTSNCGAAAATSCSSINKIDGAAPEVADAEFLAARLRAASCRSPRRTAAAWQRCKQAVLAQLPPAVEEPRRPTNGCEQRMRVAVIGRPNVGKSTLINRWLGEERQVVFDAPGTTRDAIEIPFDHDVGRFTLIDTAGVAAKAKSTTSSRNFRS